MRRWGWILTRIVRQVWFRAGLISLASVALAIVAALVTPYLPYHFATDIGDRSVGTILEIMGSSMLAVTTFSLTAMVGAYSSATQLATPRATQLLVSDSTSQNALSTFLGAFVFSIVGIIGLQTSAYGQDGRVILFGATMLVIVLVVVTLLRWIGHLAAFGRMADVIDRVEDAAVKAMAQHAASPELGGRPAVPVPPGSTAVAAMTAGYVTHIDVPLLGKLAERLGAAIHVAALPGTLVHPARPLLHAEAPVDDALRRRLIGAFAIERHRSFDQDPRLGLIALSEIASRALAPATNDPGTAIEVMNALLRVFLRLGDERPPDPAAARPAVHLGRPSIEEMLTDAFRPILREGDEEMEVVLRLLSTLGAVGAALPQARAGVNRIADEVVARARSSPVGPGEPADLEDAHRAMRRMSDGDDVGDYQPRLPGMPLNGPVTREVIQPP